MVEIGSSATAGISSCRPLATTDSPRASFSPEKRSRLEEDKLLRIDPVSPAFNGQLTVSDTAGPAAALRRECSSRASGRSPR